MTAGWGFDTVALIEKQSETGGFATVALIEKQSETGGFVTLTESFSYIITLSKLCTCLTSGRQPCTGIVLKKKLVLHGNPADSKENM